MVKDILYCTLQTKYYSNLCKINVRENRRGNQEWTIQRHRGGNKITLQCINLFLLGIYWCPTHIVLCFCLSSSCVPYVTCFSGLAIFDCPFGIL